MTTITLEGFGGMRPKVDKRLLPAMASQAAANCKLWSGSIDPIRKPLVQFTPTKAGTMLSMYRMDDRAGGSDFWLSWPFDVDAIRGAVVDTRQRVYYTGHYEPRVATYEMASAGTDTVNGSNIYPAGYGDSGTNYPLAFYSLGVHNPITLPVVAISGGIAADVSRAYLFTFVNAWGEESGASPVLTKTGKPDGTWTLSQLDTAPVSAGSIIGATYGAGIITVYTDTLNWVKPGHRLTVASVTGMTDLNGSWRPTETVNRKHTTVSRTRAANVVTLVLVSVEGLAVGQVVTIAGVGGASYNGTVTLTGVTAATNSITYTLAGANEGVTADTAGSCTLGLFRVAKVTAQSYSSGGTWKREAPWNATGMVKRIYRTLTGSAETIFQRVAEIPAATTSYADSIADTALGPAFATSGFDLPDGFMTAIVDMPNGMTAGASGNEVCFAEPYKPYAWLAQYRQPVNWPVIGLGVFGQTLAVITTGVPYRATGTHPEAVSMQVSETPFPCRSKRGIQSLGWAVVYPTDSGLAMMSPRGDELLTETFYSRDEWQSQAAGGDFEASMVYEGRYYAFWRSADLIDYAIVVDAKEVNAVITQNTERVNGAWTDPESGIAYIIDSVGKVAKWDSDQGRRQIYQWKSKEFKLPAPLNFGACRVEADFTSTPEEAAAIVAENAARQAANAILMATMPSGAFTNDPLGGSLGALAFGALAFADTILQPMLAENAQYVQFQIIAANDEGTMTVKFSKTLVRTETFRLPSGYRSDQYEFNIVGNVRTRSVKVAETADGLRAA